MIKTKDVDAGTVYTHEMFTDEIYERLLEVTKYVVRQRGGSMESAAINVCEWAMVPIVGILSGSYGAENVPDNIDVIIRDFFEAIKKAVENG